MDGVDVYVLLKIASMPQVDGWTQSGLGHDIGVSASVVNRALKKAADLNVYNSERKRVNGPPFLDALVHGARYFLTPVRGGEVRGLPTAWAAPPLVDELVVSDVLPPVWPDSMGDVRGLLLEPLHPSASQAARRDQAFYEILALVDVLRVGGIRERSLAERKLRERMSIGKGA